MATTPSAELMITPEVSRAAIVAMRKEFDKAFDKVADDAERQISKGVRDGVKDGARKSRGAFRNLIGGIGGGIRRGFDNLGGARGLAGGILGFGLVGLIDSIDRAEKGGGIITQLLGEQNAARQIATAQNAGFTLPEFAAFSRTLQRGGFTEQQDINDVIFDIQERLADAETGGNPVLKQFSGLEGRDLINTVLASISGLSGNRQAFALAELGFGGETGQNLLRVLQTASKNGKLSVDDTFTALNESSLSDGERLARTLQKTADLSKDFQELLLKKQDAQNEKLINAISGDTIKAFFEGQKPIEARQLKLLEDFEINQQNAIDARVAIGASMNILNTTVLEVIRVIKASAVALGISGGGITKEEQQAINLTSHKTVQETFGVPRASDKSKLGGL